MNLKITLLQKLLFVLFTICQISTAQIQTNQNTRIPFDSVVRVIENKYSLRLFFKPEWFDQKTYPSSIISLPATEIIGLLKTSCNCNTIIPDSTSVVFFPNDPSHMNFAANDQEYITIGDPKEYGKYSKAVLRGKVLDARTGEPLAGAKLYVEKNKTGAVANKAGDYSIVLPVGIHEIKLSFMGFEDNVNKIKLLSNGTYNFQIIEKTIKLNEVVITSDRNDHNISGTQVSMVQLTSRDIKELPVTLGERDIIKSMTLLPGVQSVGEFGTGFNVRGGSADQNLILVEDVPVFNSSHLFGLTSILNPESVSGVTLLKGGIPAKYGERASSVMDIRMGSQTDKIKARGGIGLINSRLTLEAPLFNKKLTIVAGGRTTYSDWLLHQMPDLELKNSNAGFYDLNALAIFTPNPKNKITAFAYSSSDDFTFNRDVRYNYSSQLASIRWNYVLNKYISSTLMTGISKYDYAIAEKDSLKPAEDYKIRSGLTYHNAKWNIAWHPNNKNAVDAGISAVLYSIKPGDLNPDGSKSKVYPIEVAKEKAGEFSIYLSENLEISDKLSAEGGLRYTWYTQLGPGKVYTYREGLPRSSENITDSSVYGNNKSIKRYSSLEPRFSLRYGIDDRSSVKVSYNKLNQYINLLSNTAVMTPSDVWKLSDTYIKPLTNDQFSIGYFRNFKENTIETSVELYYKDLKNTSEYKNGAELLLNNHLETDVINAKGYTYGIELYLKKTSGRLTGWASYTYSRSMRKTNGVYVSEQINNNRYFPANYDKPHDIILNANYHISRRWRFSGSFSYSTGRPVTLPELKYSQNGYQLVYYSERNKYRLPDYHRLDISITRDETLRIRQKWKGSWTFSVVNVYGRKNAYSVFYQKTTPTQSNNYKQYSLYKLYIIGMPLPTLTYNFSF